MTKLIECVPNFSEGVNLDIIKHITNEVESIEGVRLLNVDPGKATNRTVVTFVGEPEPVIEAAFLAIKKAGELIDMSKHKGFFKKIKLSEWKPDFGPAEFDAKRGATVIGALDFLIAYNVNLNTTSTRRANAVAFDVREAGRTITDEKGNKTNQLGTLKFVKAIGWYIEEYGIAQISMNLTNIEVTPVHIAFDEVCKSAAARGMRVTGSELVGLIPLKSMLDAGKYFLQKQQRSVGVSENELIKIAIKTKGLDELAPFNPDERIIEYLLKDKSASKLISMTLTDFADETASES